ncbi:hypothetical protein SEA_VIBAKI_37 [Arthrobacter phage Vibaki]|uniref:Uncharacterized protein n=1 Tax=Arthrobacter phage Vibaki TaxID=2593333 RepID=A0A514TYY7_9CAUD|nr:hypothetical protein HYP95_gp37 [Arthrobacter phage Vibaki]QDK01918.1 hypothetical protein SEA_VIBAKI_37 [Arthrobacter phage Vibaki]
MPRFNVQLEGPDGELHSWGGEADDQYQAVDLAREELDPEDVMTITDVEEEEG